MVDGGLYFDRMRQLGLYTVNVDDIKKRVKDAGLAGVLEESLT